MGLGTRRTFNTSDADSANEADGLAPRNLTLEDAFSVQGSTSVKCSLRPRPFPSFLHQQGSKNACPSQDAPGQLTVSLIVMVLVEIPGHEVANTNVYWPAGTLEGTEMIMVAGYPQS